MKNVLNLCLAILFLVVLGCGCPAKLAEIAMQNDPPPTPRPISTPFATNTAKPPETASAGEYDVTMNKFNRIKTGMKRSEVEAIVGGKGDEYYATTGGGSSFVSVRWDGKNFKSIFVNYRDDKVISKTQVGLK